MISFDSFVTGLIWMVVTLGAVLIAAALVMRRRMRGLAGVSWLLGYSVLATVGTIAVYLIPGVLGILSRPAVLATAALMLAAGVLLIRPARERAVARRPDSTAPSRLTVSTSLATLGLAAFVAFAVAHAKTVAGTAPVDTDALSFHLPGVARWIQTGSMWPIVDYLPLQAHGTYPNNGDVVLLSTVLPFHSDVLVRLAMIPFLALTGIGAYAAARELRAPASSATLAAVALTAIPAVVYPALFNVQTDPVMLAMFAAGIYFLLRHRRTGVSRDLVLAGLALGIAFGTKWYAVSAVAVVVAVWAAAWLVARRDLRATARGVLALGGLVMAAGGFWLIRNLIETGDPLYPVNVSPLGITIFGAPPDFIRQAAGFTIADYLGSPHILAHYVAPALWRTLGLSTVLMCSVAVVSGAAVAVRRARGGESRDDGPVIVLAVGVVLLAIAYIFTPYTALGAHNRPLQVDANARYLMPAVVPAAILTAWSAGRLGRWRWLLEAALLAGIVESIRRTFGLHVSGTVVVLGLLVLLAASFRAQLWRLRTRPAARGAAIAAAAAAVLAAAVVERQRFSDRVYRTDAVLAWVLDHAPASHQIGIAGAWSHGIPPILPAFGPRFGNHVSYVGPVVGHMLRDYAQVGAFDAALRHARYDLLIVGLGTGSQSDDEGRWAEHAGYREVVRSNRFMLLRAG